MKTRWIELKPRVADAIERISSALVLFAVLALGVWGCAKTGSISAFRFRDTDGWANSSFRWGDAMRIDGDEFATNNDMSTGCRSLLDFDGIAGVRGCMQPSPIVYSGIQWFAGLLRNSSAFPTQSAFSIFSSLSSLTFAAPVLNDNLFLIDEGAVGIDWATRYLQFAKLTNGNVVAVFASQGAGGTDEQIVFANVYNANAAVPGWTGPVRLSSAAVGVVLETGSDMEITIQADPPKTPAATFCRPSVSAAGDNSALVTWCERDKLDAVDTTKLMYAVYQDNWSPSAEVVAPTTTGLLPGFAASSYSWTDLDGDIQAGDEFHVTYTHWDGEQYEATATAVDFDSTPGSGEFAIMEDGSGGIDYCATLAGMGTALVSGLTNNGTDAALTTFGVSAEVASNCDNATNTTYVLALFYNRSLLNTYRSNTIATFTSMTDVRSLATIYTEVPVDASSPAAAHYRTAMSSVAGDSSGNYIAVRSLVAPVIKSVDTTWAAPIQTSKARMLVGHEFNAGSGWVTRGGEPGSGEIATSFISNLPTCNDGTYSVECSVRNPKALLSNDGHGLVLYYQNQPSATGLDDNTDKNPSRLWYSEYVRGQGFSLAPSILDNDVKCSTGSGDTVTNDEPVCETGSYDTNFECQRGGNSDPTNWGEPQAGPVTLNHDIVPIAAAMNGLGEAIVAYHKKVKESDGSCGFYRTIVKTYDRATGFTAVEGGPVDDGAGHTMHVQVAISPAGNMAVVWEELAGTAKYVYVRARMNGIWLPQKQVNPSTDAFDSMMPSVGINDAGEVVVSYTYGATANGNRRQYVRHYFNH